MALHFDDRTSKGYSGTERYKLGTQRPAASPSPGKREHFSLKRMLRPDQQTDVLLITQDTELSAKLEAGFVDKNQLPDLVIFDLNNANLVDIEALDRLKKTKFPKTPAIVLSTYLDQDVVRSLMQMKIDDWLPKDSVPSDVHRACERAMRTHAMGDRDRERDADCHAFFSTTGGCGNTTLAIQAAFHLGRKRKNLRSTCLVDLNFQDGAVCDYLDLTPASRRYAGAPLLGSCRACHAEKPRALSRHQRGARCLGLGAFVEVLRHAHHRLAKKLVSVDG
jgi:CheY-like chemotaxis protein